MVYLVYFRYFRVKPGFLYHLEYFIFGVLLALLVLVFRMLMFPEMPREDPFVFGFLYASLIEKGGAFFLIQILVYSNRSRLSVPESTVMAMLVGLGFAALENVVSAFNIQTSLIVVRSVSSVQMHMLTCGLIGYYLSLARLNDSNINKTSIMLKAFLVPFLFHGIFDSLLTIGGTKTYLIAFLIILLIVTKEYFFQKSKVLPRLEELRKDNLSLEDWKTLQHESQYERWIQSSMGAKNKGVVPFFHFNLNLLKIAGIFAIAAAVMLSYYNRDLISSLLKIKFKREEVIMLFSLLPALYALNLLIIGIINSEYFRRSVIRMPIVIDVVLSPGVDISNDDVIDTTTYHITGLNSYIKTTEALKIGQEVKCILFCSRFSSPVLSGAVVWEEHNKNEQFNGSLIRFRSRPPGFWLFLVRYYLYRVSRGVTFNLNLPGSKHLRQLFVRPISVMEKEERFAAGDILFRQDERGGSFYLIRKGKVDIIKTLKTGKQILMATHSRGDIFGEMALVGDQPRLAAAVCKTECVIAKADADNLEALIRGNPEFTHTLIKTFANRLYKSEKTMLGKIANLTRTADRGRELLHALMKLLFAGTSGRGKDKKINIDVDTEKIDALLDGESDITEKLIEVIEKSLDPEEIERYIGAKQAKKIIKSLKDYKIVITKK